MPEMQTSPEDSNPARAGRRKACDLCFTKKIKCDMLKPVCSNCKIYHVDCRTSIIRRKGNAARSRQAQRAQREEANDRTETLKARLARIEKQLQQVLDTAKASQSSTASAQSARQEDRSSEGTEDVQENERIFTDGPAMQDWQFDPIHPNVYRGPQPDSLSLPPLEDVLPAVDHYFATYNTLVPLFDQGKFMKMLQGWYTQRTPHDRSTWAAIQIVMAIGYRTPKAGDAETTPISIHLADQCLKNAQSVVSELVTREDDLLGIQILLGIVMMFQNSGDPRPASVIVGTAVRLAHRLRLHSNDASQLFTAEEAEQRSRVFWITYILDKDISLRAKTPSAQFDEDIDIPLPPAAPEDGAGMLWTKDGQNHFNYHRLRVELAHIQGKVYDLLYSNRAMRVKGIDRQQRVSRLQSMLDGWYSRVPLIFRIEHVASTVDPSEMLQITKMHHAFLLSEVMTHGIYSHDADWIKRIGSFSRAAMRELSQEYPPYAPRNSSETKAPPLPAGWSKCVEISRGCMKLFQEASPTECLIWQCSCAHFSALIIILANMGIYPLHPCVSFDQHLAARALHLFDRLLEVVDNEGFHTLRVVVGELDREANAAVDAARLEESPAKAGGLDLLRVDGGMGDGSTPVLDFLPLGTDPEGFGGTFGGANALLEGGSITFAESSASNLLEGGGGGGETLHDMSFVDFLG